MGKKKNKRGEWSYELTPEAYEALKKLHEKEQRAMIKREDDKKGYDTYSK